MPCPMIVAAAAEVEVHLVAAATPELVAILLAAAMLVSLEFYFYGYS